MNPQYGRLGLNLAAWIVGVAVFLLFFLERDSAEFIITVFCLVIGMALGGFAWFLTRRSMH